jgi:tetratricopeptide (TPR) repeat protein
MTVRSRIFISAVTSEFGGVRRKVADILRRLGYDPVLQDIFGTESGDLRQMLRDTIDTCGGLIQIVGHAYGAEPPVEDDEFGRVSYTQFEFLYAAAQGKQTWLIMAGDGCARDKSPDRLDLPADPQHADPQRHQSERREWQQAYRERLRSSGHLWHDVEDDKDLEIKIRDLRNEFAVLRKSFRRWQSWVLTAILAILLVLGGISFGVYWTVFYQPEEVARHLADPDIIRAKLQETIEATFERDRKQAEQLDDWQDRERAVRLAREARDRRLAEVDDFIESVTRTISEGNASPEYLELNRILEEQGVDAALAYVDSQWQRLLAEMQPEVADVERAKRDVRRKLMPGLESVRLMVAKGEYDAALLRCEQLLASDATWPEARHEHIWIRIDLGDQAELYGTIHQALEHFESATDSAQFLHQADPSNATAQRDLSVSYNELGDAIQQAGDLDQAREYFLKDLAIAEKLAADDPSNATAQRDVMVSHYKLGRLSKADSDFPSAIRHFEAGANVLRRMIADGKLAAQSQKELAILEKEIATCRRLQTAGGSREE